MRPTGPERRRSIIGGETEGVGPELAAWATEEVGIPLDHGVESLNAAVAGAVILFEAARQRRLTRAERTRTEALLPVHDGADPSQFTAYVRGFSWT